MVDKTKVIRIFEAFAGIGSQRRALDNIKMKYSVSGMAEWFLPAILSYQLIHNDFKIIEDIDLEDMKKYLESKTLSMNSKDPVRKGYWNRKDAETVKVYYSAVFASEKEGNIFDIRTLYKRGMADVDLATYSFPCQDLSQQGKQLGMKRGSGTRSGLLWEIEKALDSTPKKKLPKYLLMENVMSLSFSRNKDDFTMWQKKLNDLGYVNDIKILNSSHFGSSQARRRVFMLSVLKKKIELPSGDIKNIKSMMSVLSKETREIDQLPKLEKYDRTEFKTTRSNIRKFRLSEKYTTFNSEAYVYHPEFCGPTLTASGANSRIKIFQNKRIRKMNAIEAYKYMGFKSSDYKKINKVKMLTENKMIYTCGNSISVEVLENIFERIKND